MKVALVGHGMVADTHVRALNDSNTVNWHGLLGRDSESAKRYANGWNSDVAVYESVSDLCSDSSLDFVIVATPPNARLEIVQALCDAGLPILMEKPIERTLDAARRVADICDEHDVLAGLLFQHRARQASHDLKRLITTGVIGELMAGEIRVPWWRDQNYYDEPGRGSYERDGGGVMINQAIHTLDLAMWFMGPVATVQALMRTTDLHRMEAEDWAGGIFRFENGTAATLNATTSFYPGSTESIRLQGTKAHALLEAGSLTVSYLDGQVEVFGDAKEGTGGGADPMAFTHAWHQAVIEDFADCVKSRGTPICTVREGVNVHAVIEAMERSSKSGQAVDLIT